MPLLDSFVDFITQFGSILLGWGWLVVLMSMLWISWRVYLLVKVIDYLSGIQWTYLQISVPQDSAQTPKAMENAFEVWGGMHKPPDIVERFFEGYQDAWYSCEIQCQLNRVRYVMVVPTLHRKFIEGVIYGQYPTAEVKEVEDYTQEYSYEDLETKFDMFGAEIILAKDDIFPIKLYAEYEDRLAEDDRFIDPHQALLEAYSNIEEGEEFWVQILIRPVDAKVIQEWVDKGEEEISVIAGTAKEEPPGIVMQLVSFFKELPGELLKVITTNQALEPESKKDEQKFRLFNPVDEAKMKGILQKVSKSGFRTKIRVIYISPPGRFRKPAQSVAIGAFKQFNTFHLNSLKPDSDTKTSGPTYFFKQSRRRFRKRQILLNFQWRDFFGNDAGFMMTAEELATLYHFPVKYVRSPVVEHALSGLGSAPENIPFAS